LALAAGVLAERDATFTTAGAAAALCRRLQVAIRQGPVVGAGPPNLARPARPESLTMYVTYRYNSTAFMQRARKPSSLIFEAGSPAAASLSVEAKADAVVEMQRVFRAVAALPGAPLTFARSVGYRTAADSFNMSGLRLITPAADGNLTMLYVTLKDLDGAVGIASTPVLTSAWISPSQLFDTTFVSRAAAGVIASITPEEIMKTLRAGVISKRCFPVLCGAGEPSAALQRAPRTLLLAQPLATSWICMLKART
jgi:hypothetical protein